MPRDILERINLFNPKTITRHIGTPAAIPDTRRDIAGRWSAMIADKRVETLKETELHSEFNTQIVQGLLGYTGASAGAAYSVSFVPAHSGKTFTMRTFSRV